MVRSPCSKILEIPGGRWVLKDALERKILGGGAGMDIFWNHTLFVSHWKFASCKQNTYAAHFQKQTGQWLKHFFEYWYVIRGQEGGC